MSYWVWGGSVAILGLFLGTILFYIAYWSGKRKARARRNAEERKANGH